MNQKFIIAGAIIIFAIGMYLGGSIIDMFRQPPQPSEETQTLIGSSVPIYQLKALDGVVESSDQWAGKVQIVNFWATWCPPCKREIPALMALQEQYGDKGLQIIGIAIDNEQRAKDYAIEHNINYAILLGKSDATDISEMLGNDMGILPYTVIIDRQGKIQYVKYGEADQRTLEKEILPLL